MLLVSFRSIIYIIVEYCMTWLFLPRIFKNNIKKKYVEYIIFTSFNIVSKWNIRPRYRLCVYTCIHILIFAALFFKSVDIYFCRFEMLIYNIRSFEFYFQELWKCATRCDKIGYVRPLSECRYRMDNAAPLPKSIQYNICILSICSSKN